MKRISTPPAHGHTLIINDGSLGGLLACWSEGVVRSNLVNAGASPAASGLTAWMPADDRPCFKRRRAVVESQVELCALAGWSDRQLLRAEGLAAALPEGAAAGVRATTLLLCACLEARARGLTRIVWPVHLGGIGNGGGDGQDRQLEELAAAADRALLVSQLMVVDSAGSHAPGHSPALLPRIETPYIDFTDAQLMDLALDMDAPLGSCWWCVNDQETPCEQCAQCMRWREALITVDPARSLSLQTLRAPTTASGV